MSSSVLIGLLCRKPWVLAHAESSSLHEPPRRPTIRKRPSGVLQFTWPHSPDERSSRYHRTVSPIASLSGVAWSPKARAKAE